MKRKITAVLLCIALLLTLSVNALADTEIHSTDETQLTPVTDEITVTVGDSGVAVVDSTVTKESVVMPLAETSGIVSGGIYRIKNVASGKYMNVDYGIDANGTNIYQWTGDGSVEQKFKVVYSSSTDSYMFYAMCSSNGTNRVVDVTRGSSPLTNGQNVKLYNPTDPTSQEIKIISVGSGKYRLAMRANTTLGLAAYGTSNGSASGTTSTSSGNIFLSTYTGATNQQWQFELLQNPNTGATPIGCLDTVSSTLIGGWAYQSDIPNTALTVHIYIINNSTGEQKIIGVTAGGYRADLKNAGYGNGYHAFHYAVNWKTYKPGTYTVRAYAIGVNSSNPQLSYSPKTFTVRSATGNVEYVNSSGIGGWAWKPDAPDLTIDVHIYIYKSNGAQVAVYSPNAWQPRPDLLAAGYGDGDHGFAQAIDWSALPEERLRVVVYAVDGSGYNPSFYSGYYDNRMPITLLGMKESKYQHDLSSWMWSSNVVGYCENIGFSALDRFNYATDNDYNYSYTRFIKESSYCAIFTHGTSDGKGIEWSMYGIYHDPSSYQVYGLYTTDDLAELSNDYFSKTRCVVLMSCNAGLGGASNSNNFVNTLQSKGVWTVVGFEDEIIYYYDNNDDNPEVHTDDVVNVNLGAQYWIILFTKYLGEGKTVSKAADDATKTVYETQVENERIYGDDEVDNYCGLDSCYIAGDKTQVIKH